MPPVVFITVAVLVGAEMAPIVWPVVGVVLAAVIGGGFAYRAQRHSASGTIESSTAGDIWEQTRALLGDYKGEVISLRGDVQNLRTALDNSLERESVLRERVAVLEHDLAEMRTTHG